MFTELMPLIKQRPLTITVAVEGNSQIRLNVVPKPIEKDKAANSKIASTHSKEVAPIPDEAIKALTTPLSIVGTPEEVDAGLRQTLANFAASHQTLQQSFDTAAAHIAEAVKAIDERERIKKEKDKASKKTTTTGAPAKQPQETKAAEESTLPSLFTVQAVSANEPPAAGTNAKPDVQADTQAGSEGDE